MTMPHAPFSTNKTTYRSDACETPWTIAAPSFVRPAGIAENCDFLAEHVDEVGLCLFEANACLEYGVSDLPPRLAELPLSYHIHLPLDLDWTTPAVAWDAVRRLVGKTSFLSPTAFVFHPHNDILPREIEQQFQRMGIAPSQVLLENIHGQPLTNLWPELMQTSLSVCLDLGHLLAYDQQPLLDLPGLWDRVRMAHLYAPDPVKPSRHAGLALLDRSGRELLHCILAHLPHDATVMLEVFGEPGLMASLNFFKGFMPHVLGR